MAATSEEGATRSSESWWTNRSLWMCVSYIAIAIVLSMVLLSNLFFHDLLAGLRHAVAATSAAAMSALGFPISNSGTVIHGPNTSLSIVNECTGVDATILLVSAVLVFPAAFRQKLAGLGFAIAVMMVINFVRVLTLIYLGNYFPDLLDLGHLYIWPVIVIIVGVGTLLLWADRVVAHSA